MAAMSDKCECCCVVMNSAIARCNFCTARLRLADAVLAAVHKPTVDAMRNIDKAYEIYEKEIADGKEQDGR